ncbi:class I SAM-dependent methyltransferase [Lacipirellula sp.]|uniref:class I SAM-dependent methyltransferase n=1 Tax=Lacipirellula sp. TaxID=2691419 RepID=UPI003D109D33
MSLKSVLRQFRRDRRPQPTRSPASAASVALTPINQPAAPETDYDRDFRAACQALKKFHAPYRLHIGCGKVHFPGWVNVDRDPMSEIVDVSWDLRHSLPIHDGTVEYIFHEHFMEHLTVEEGLALSRECRRMLKPGGILRIGMPDLADVVRQYAENDWRLPWMKKYGYEHIQTRAENINIAFREWEHKWLYDREELHRRLCEAGFETIRDAVRKESTVEALRGLETRDETLLVVEAIK